MWPTAGASGSDGEARGQPRHERAEHRPLEQHAGERGRQRDGRRRPCQHGRHGARVAAARAQQRHRAAALAGRHRQRLHERVEADEPDREADAAQHGGEHREELPVAGGRRGGGARRSADLGQLARDRGAVGAGIQPHDDPRLEPRVAREQPLGPHPADPAGVLQRAHDARHAEADLGAAAQLGGHRRARPQPERVGEAEADLDLARPSARAGPTPAAAPRTPCGRPGRRRAASARRAGTSPPRRSRSGGPRRRRPARRGSPRASTPAPTRSAGSACRPCPGRRAGARAGRRARASGRPRPRRRRSSPPRRRSARAPRSRSARRAPSRPPRASLPARTVTSPPRRISAGGRRAARHAGQVAAATTIATTREQRQRQRRDQVVARRALVERGQQLRRRPGHGERADRQSEPARPARPRASPRPPAAPRSARA